MYNSTITIKELAEKIQEISPYTKMVDCRGTAKMCKQIIWYAEKIKKLSGTVKHKDGCLIFKHKNGNGKVPLNAISEKILLPCMNDLFYKKK